ncbi:MAG: hypothetical protein L6R42_003756 [Xanthoria sp. 1 TBL-2021]|nr:MAG: hypothetical protein L6R42_003756 [Xanthoria sp. 1 TBL-2021]
MLFPSVSLVLSAPAIAAAALGSNQVQVQQPLTSEFSKIPSLGFGTWNLDQSNVSEAVSAALHTGYRHIDCATVYGNQKAVGKGIAHGLKSLNLHRSDIWVTSKLWNDHHDPSLVEEALTQTLHDLGLAYLDLWLMHWPVGNAPDTGKSQLDYLQAWHAMEKIHKTGRVRNIGLSNFSPAQLKDIIDHSDTKPSVHQFEVHPYLPQSRWIEFQQQLGISVTAYSPFANTNPTYKPSKDDPPYLLTNFDMLAVAAKNGCTTAQVALAWGMSRGYSVIPKSSHVNHIKENFGALDCHLEKEDLERIDEISEKHLKRFNNPSKGYGVKLFDGLEDA